MPVHLTEEGTGELPLRLLRVGEAPDIWLGKQVPLGDQPELRSIGFARHGGEVRSKLRRELQSSRSGSIAKPVESPDLPARAIKNDCACRQATTEHGGAPREQPLGLGQQNKDWKDEDAGKLGAHGKPGKETCDGEPHRARGLRVAIERVHCTENKEGTPN